MGSSVRRENQGMQFEMVGMHIEEGKQPLFDVFKSYKLCQNTKPISQKTFTKTTTLKGY